MKRVELKLSNYYGALTVVEVNGNHYIELDDYGSRDVQQISKELHDLLIKELEDKEED